MKPILAYDCATVGASLALLVDGHIHTRAIGQTRQAAELVPAIDALLREHHVSYADLGCIVSTIGPGSFTGVRIGLAALHGLVLVSQTPIKLVTTLQAMTWRIANAPTEYYITLRAGKGEVYAQRFAATTARGDIFLAPETKQDWDLPCFGNVPDMHSPHYIAGASAETLCTIADQLPNATLADALPLYIRPPDAKQPAPLSWLS